MNENFINKYHQMQKAATIVSGWNRAIQLFSRQKHISTNVAKQDPKQLVNFCIWGRLDSKVLIDY